MVGRQIASYSVSRDVITNVAACKFANSLLSLMTVVEFALQLNYLSMPMTVFLSTSVEKG